MIDLTLWAVAPWIAHEGRYLRFYLTVRLDEPWKARKLRERLGYGFARGCVFRVAARDAVQFCEAVGLPEAVVGPTRALCAALDHQGRGRDEAAREERRRCAEALLAAWRQSLLAAPTSGTRAP